MMTQIMNNIFIEIAGWTGSFLILLAYVLLTSHKISSDSKYYQLLNIAGSLLLVFNTIYHRALPPATLNIFWLAIGLYSLIRSAFNKRAVG